MCKSKVLGVLVVLIAVNCITSDGVKSEENIYNEHDSSKNLLLRFLHDDVPIVNDSEEGDKKYYSDISNENISFEDSEFYIVDMDGDGINEFGYYCYPMLDIIKYDKEEDNFELWISVKSQQ